MDENLKKAASAFGKMGGKANYEKNGKDHMKAISKLAAAARKKNKAKREATKLPLDKPPTA